MPFPRPITYVPGPTTAVVGDGVALLVEADPTGALVAACRAALADGRGVDDVVGVLAEGPQPSFALAATAGGGLRLLVGGRAQAEFAGGVAATVSAAGLAHWLDQQLDGSPDLRLSLADPAAPIDPLWPLLPIDAGVVLAAALIVPAVAAVPALDVPAAVAVPAVVPDPPAAAPPSAQATVDPDSDTGQVAVEPDVGLAGLPWRGAEPDANELSPPSTEPTVVGALPPGYPHEWQPAAEASAYPPPPYPPAPTHEPAPAYVAPAISSPPAAESDAPMVQAVICANNHLNAPFVVGACRVCGAPVPAQAPFLAPRPTLGVLVLASGETVPVDRDVLLGRAPFSVDGVEQNSPRIVTLPSPNNDLSRTHVRVAIDGWLVQVVDLGSTNGTVATMPGQQGVRLRAHDPFVLVPGTVVNLADEATVRFEVPS